MSGEICSCPYWCSRLDPTFVVHSSRLHQLFLHHLVSRWLGLEKSVEVYHQEYKLNQISCHKCWPLADVSQPVVHPNLAGISTLLPKIDINMLYSDKSHIGNIIKKVKATHSTNSRCNTNLSDAYLLFSLQFNCW